MLFLRDSVVYTVRFRTDDQNFRLRGQNTKTLIAKIRIGFLTLPDSFFLSIEKKTSPKGRVRSVKKYTYLVKSTCNLIKQQQRRPAAALWGSARGVDTNAPGARGCVFFDHEGWEDDNKGAERTTLRTTGGVGGDKIENASTRTPTR